MKITVVKNKQEAIKRWLNGEDVRECDTLQCTCISLTDLNMVDVLGASEEYCFYVVVES